MSEFIPLAKLADIPPGRGLTVYRGPLMLALFEKDGETFAIEGTCPHRAAPLGEGWCEHGTVSCPMHGWTFDLRTGECIDRADKPVRVFESRVIDGMVEVRID